MARLYKFRGCVIDLGKLSFVGSILSEFSQHRYKILIDGRASAIKLTIHMHKSTATRQLHEFMNERRRLIEAWAAYHGVDAPRLCNDEAGEDIYDEGFSAEGDSAIGKV